MQLIVTPAGPSSVALTLMSDSGPTGYVLLSTVEWGDSAWDHAYSGPRGTLGARAAEGTPQNRLLGLPLRVYGTSKDDLAAKLSALALAADDLRRYSGKVTWRSNSQTYRQHFDVMAGEVALLEWGNRAEASFRAGVTLRCVCAPYLEGDAMTFVDDFSTDSIAAGDWTGNTSSFTVSGGQLAPTGTSYAHIAHDDRYQLKDIQVTVKVVTGASVVSQEFGVLVRYYDTSNFIWVSRFGSNIIIGKRVAGANTTLATIAAAALAAGTTYWVRGRIEGTTIYAEAWTGLPTPAGAAAFSGSYDMSATDQGQFAAPGWPGIRFAGGTGIDHRLDDFSVVPFTYKGRDRPYLITLAGTIPGDATARAEASITMAASGSSSADWALVGWHPTPPGYSLIYNGDFELGTAGWSVAAVAGMSGAASSITRVTTAAKFGIASGEVVCPATNGVGANFAVYGRFRKGVTYTAKLWVRSAAQTTPLRVIVGVNPDIVADAAGALSTTWTEHTVSWTPTADSTVAYVVPAITAATATTFQVDGVTLYEGTVAPTLATQIEGRGAPPPFGVLWAANADTVFTFAVTAGELVADTAPGTAGTVTLFVDPSQLVPDDYSMGEVEVEVYAHIAQISTMVTPAVQTALIPEEGIGYGSARYTREYGTTSKPIAVTASASKAYNVIRLGTIAMPVDRARPARWKLQLAFTWGSTSVGNLYLDYLILVPARSRALLPTGIEGGVSTYPTFQVVAGEEITRVIRSDLSTLSVHQELHRAPYTDVSMGGSSMLEVPVPALSVMAYLSDGVPDDPTPAQNDSAFKTATLSFNLVPRFHYLRT